MGELKYSEKTTTLISLVIILGLIVFVVWMLWNKEIKLQKDTVIVCEDFCAKNGLEIYHWVANYYGDTVGLCKCIEPCEEYKEYNYSHCPFEPEMFKLVWSD